MENRIVNKVVTSDCIDSAKCPITKEKMIDPVLAVPTGNSYEKNAIQTWIDSGNSDPLTREPITQLIPNRTLAEVLREIDKKGLILKDGNQKTEIRVIEEKFLQKAMNLIYKLFADQQIKHLEKDSPNSIRRLSINGDLAFISLNREENFIEIKIESYHVELTAQLLIEIDKELDYAESIQRQLDDQKLAKEKADADTAKQNLQNEKTKRNIMVATAVVGGIGTTAMSAVALKKARDTFFKDDCSAKKSSELDINNTINNNFSIFGSCIIS